MSLLSTFHRIKHSRRIADSIYQAKLDLGKAEAHIEDLSSSVTKLRARIMRLQRQLDLEKGLEARNADKALSYLYFIEKWREKELFPEDRDPEA